MTISIIWKTQEFRHFVTDAEFGLHLPSLRLVIWQSAASSLAEKLSELVFGANEFRSDRRFDLVSHIVPLSRMALSLKQPWATLVVSGRKSIEIRTWGTTFRGTVLIHAGKIPDKRPEAWKWVDSPELKTQAELKGGVIGEATVFGCRLYRTLTSFEDDRDLHLNESTWFQPPRMYGFEFRDARPIPFQPVKGQTLFFTVKGLASHE